MGRPGRLGPAQARLRDRQEDRRRLPPALVQRRRRDARRDRARPQDRRQRDAPPGDPSLQARFDSASSGGRARRARMSPNPSTPRWRRSNAPEHQQRRPRRQPDEGSRAAPHAVRDRGHDPPHRRQRPRQARRGVDRCGLLLRRHRLGPARPRTARSTSPRAARSASRASSPGASGTPRTARKRQSVEIVADNVQFLGSRGEDGGGQSQQFVPRAPRQSTDDFPPRAAADDDIPF